MKIEIRQTAPGAYSVTVNGQVMEVSEDYSDLLMKLLIDAAESRCDRTLIKDGRVIVDQLIDVE